MLERVKYELKAIMDVQIEKGDVWKIDDFFGNKYKELSKLVSESKTKMDDKSLPKKERKKHKKFFEDNYGLERVCASVYMAGLDLSYDTFSRPNVGLEDVVTKY